MSSSAKVDPYHSGIDPFDRETEQVVLDNLRALQPIPPFSLDPLDFRRELVEGRQPPDVTGTRVYDGMPVPMPGSGGERELAHQAVHMPFRDLHHGIAAPEARNNFKTWGAFEAGYGRCVMRNENALFENPERLTNDLPFTGDILILNKEFVHVPLKQSYTDQELLLLFGKPSVFNEGTFAWYAYQWSGTNPDQRMYFAYDRQMLAWVPRYEQGNRVFPVEWDPERWVNKPPSVPAPIDAVEPAQTRPVMPKRGDVRPVGYRI